MKKKIGKKVKKVEEEEETTELPMAKTGNEDDVEEGYQVADMSDVAAPVIEFVMPNLTTPDDEPSKPATKTSAIKKPAKKETLTAEILNNEITKMRATITTAKNRLISKSIRRKKDLESKAKKLTDEKKKEKFTKHSQRLGEEIEHMKTIDRDTIAKFALLNQKTLEELKMAADTPVNTRLLYKLACHEVVVKVVESYRQKYVDFNKSAAFFLQRLGLQYSHLKKEKGEGKKKEVETEENEQKESENDDEEEEEREGTGEEEEEEDNAGSEEFDESDVEMVDSDDDAEKEASAKRRALLLGLIGVKEDKARPNLKPKKRKIQEEEEKTAEEKSAPAAKIVKKAAMKEDVKKILEEQLKSVKAKKPKVVTQKKAGKKVEKMEEENDLEVDFDEDEPTTLIQKIDLSAGGKIGKKAKKSEPILAKSKSTEISKEDDEEEGAFFLPKNGISKIADKTETVEVKEKEEKKNRGASKKKAAQTGEMHPSWAASQQKKKEMQSAKPCGKKITFDD